MWLIDFFIIKVTGWRTWRKCNDQVLGCFVGETWTAFTQSWACLCRNSTLKLIIKSACWHALTLDWLIFHCACAGAKVLPPPPPPPPPGCPLCHPNPGCFDNRPRIINGTCECECVHCSDFAPPCYDAGECKTLGKPQADPTIPGECCRPCNDAVSDSGEW